MAKATGNALRACRRPRKSLGVERNARLADELRQLQAQAAQVAQERKAAAYAREKRLVDRQCRRSQQLAQTAPRPERIGNEGAEKELGECKATLQAQGKQPRPADQARRRRTQQEGPTGGAVQSDLERSGRNRKGKKRKSRDASAVDSAYEVEGEGEGEGGEIKTPSISFKGRKKRIRALMVDPDYSDQEDDVSARLVTPARSTRSKRRLGVPSEEEMPEQPDSILVPAVSSLCKRVTNPSISAGRMRARTRVEATGAHKEKKRRKKSNASTPPTTTTTPKNRHKTPKPPLTWKNKEKWGVESKPAQQATNLEKEIALLEQRAAAEWLEERQERRDCAGIRGLGAFDRSTIYRLREAYAEREAKRLRKDAK